MRKIKLSITLPRLKSKINRAFLFQEGGIICHGKTNERRSRAEFSGGADKPERPIEVAI